MEWPSQNLPTFTHVFSIACNTHFHKNWQFMIMKAWRMQKTLVPAINLKTWKIYPMGWTVPPTGQTLMEKMWLWVEVLVILLKVLIFCDSWSFKIKKPFFLWESGMLVEWPSQNLPTFTHVVSTNELRKAVRCFCQKATGSRETGPESFGLENKNYNLCTK